MLSATFSIDVDPPRELVRIRMAGFFSINDIERFQVELMQAHRRLGCGRSGGPLTINDISRLAIQDQDVLPRWRSFLANPAHRSRRLAFVVASALARMQLQRTLGDRDARVFTDTIEAEQWLLAEDTNVAA